LHAGVDGAVAFAGVEIEAEPAEKNELPSFLELVVHFSINISWEYKDAYPW